MEALRNTISRTVSCVALSSTNRTVFIFIFELINYRTETSGAFSPVLGQNLSLRADPVLFLKTFLPSTSLVKFICPLPDLFLDLGKSIIRSSVVPCFARHDGSG